MLVKAEDRTAHRGERVVNQTRDQPLAGQYYGAVLVHVDRLAGARSVDDRPAEDRAGEVLVARLVVRPGHRERVEQHGVEGLAAVGDAQRVSLGRRVGVVGGSVVAQCRRAL